MDKQKFLERWEELENQWIKWPKRRKIMNKEFNKNYTSQDSIRQMISRIRKSPINQLAESSHNFEFEGEDIIFTTTKTNTHGERYKEVIPVPIDDIVKYSQEYVRLWGNKTVGKMSRKLWVKPEALRLMFRRLNVSKESNVIPDAILDRIEEIRGLEAVDEVIIKASHKAVKNKYTDKFIYQADKALERHDDKVRRVFANMDNFLEHLNDKLYNYEPEKIKFKHKRKKKDKEALYVITDLHLCKKWTGDIIKRLWYIVEDAINDEAEHINMLCLWDLCESFAPWGMHAGQESHMEKTWFDVYPYIVNALCSMVEEIWKYKSISFHWITWNHDRIAQWHDGDMERTWGLSVYFMMQLKLWEDIVNYYRDKWNTVIFDGIGYILHHWDDRATNKSTWDIVKENRPNTEHMIIAMWDKHHYEWKNETNWISRLICPALAWVWEYDSRLRLSSYSWYVRITKNRFWFPRITPEYLP